MTNAPIVFAAGQGPFGEDGGIVGLGDPAAQFRTAVGEPLDRAAEAGGASLATIVSQTVYLARAEDFPCSRNDAEGCSRRRSRRATTLRVDLLEPGMLVEISAIAAVGIARA